MFRNTTNKVAASGQLFLSRSEGRCIPLSSSAGCRCMELSWVFGVERRDAPDPKRGLSFWVLEAKNRATPFRREWSPTGLFSSTGRAEHTMDRGRRVFPSLIVADGFPASTADRSITRNATPLRLGAAPTFQLSPFTFHPSGFPYLGVTFNHLWTSPDGL